MSLPKGKCSVMLILLKKDAGQAVGERTCGGNVSGYIVDVQPHATNMIA